LSSAYVFTSWSAAILATHEPCCEASFMCLPRPNPAGRAGRALTREVKT
jgi:hypothetical protein